MVDNAMRTQTKGDGVWRVQKRLGEAESDAMLCSVGGLRLGGLTIMSTALMLI